MTPAERARRALAGMLGREPSTTAVEVVAGAIAEAVADERTRIGAWLVERHGLHGVARAVERGAHEAST